MGHGPKFDLLICTFDGRPRIELDAIKRLIGDSDQAFDRRMRRLGELLRADPAAYRALRERTEMQRRNRIKKKERGSGSKAVTNVTKHVLPQMEPPFDRCELQELCPDPSEQEDGSRNCEAGSAVPENSGRKTKDCAVQ